MTLYRRLTATLSNLGVFIAPPGKVLDVALHRDGVVRRWTIAPGWPGGRWTCRLNDGTTVTVFSCATVEDVLVTGIRWRADIAAFKEDGWADI